MNVVYVRSRLHQLIRTVVLTPLLLSGCSEEKQHLQVELFSDFVDDQDLPVTDAYVEIQSRAAQLYGVELQIEAHFTGLRYVMFHWPKLSCIVGISTNLFFVSLIFILSWYHLQDGLPDFVKGKFGSEGKSENDDGDDSNDVDGDGKFRTDDFPFHLEGEVKLEREDSSAFLEDSFLEDLPPEEIKPGKIKTEPTVLAT